MGMSRRHFNASDTAFTIRHIDEVMRNRYTHDQLRDKIEELFKTSARIMPPLHGMERTEIHLEESGTYDYFISRLGHRTDSWMIYERGNPAL